MYRRKVLTPPIDERLKTMVMQIIEKWGQEFIEIEVRPNDYVHLLVGCDPQFGTGGKLVKYIKEASSHQLRKEFSALKRRLPSL